MSVNYVALGKRIGYFRMQCGNITQEALASKINRSREFLAKIEKGTEHPSVATLVDIADALCISVDDLLLDSLRLFRFNFQHRIASSVIGLQRN